VKDWGVIDDKSEGDDCDQVICTGWGEPRPRKICCLLVGILTTLPSSGSTTSRQWQPVGDVWSIRRLGDKNELFDLEQSQRRVSLTRLLAVISKVHRCSGTNWQSKVDSPEDNQPLPRAEEVAFKQNYLSDAVMLGPRGQSGLEAKILALASASKIWPRPGLHLVVLLCNRAFFGQKSCKIREFW